jgi:hypothetical protein
VTHLTYVAVAFVCVIAIVSAAQLTFHFLNKWRDGAGPAFIVMVVTIWIIVGIVAGLVSDNPRSHAGYDPSIDDLGCVGPPAQTC